MTKSVSTIVSSTSPGSQQSILLRDYAGQVFLTDQLPENDMRPVLFGLFGEVGSVMAIIKKLHREEYAYAGYRTAVVEELGDVLWYFTNLCRRLGYCLEEIFADVVTDEQYSHMVAASDVPTHPLSRVSGAANLPSLDDVLLRLGGATSALLSVSGPSTETEGMVRSFADMYLQTVQTASLPFAEIVCTNIEKARGRFLEPDCDSLPDFDASFPKAERLPDKFEIVFTQRKNGQSYLQWNGVFIGDPLTDNIGENDSYRFHDVFHLAHAAILHWSPTFRALIKQKRKSDSAYDRDQDGGRAIVVEEGLTAWIFSSAKNMGFFEDQSRLSFDLLKGVQEFVRGYEVEACPLSLWERAILNGYSVFRELKQNNGGIVVGDRHTRTICYRPLVED